MGDFPYHEEDFYVEPAPVWVRALVYFGMLAFAIAFWAWVFVLIYSTFWGWP